MPGYHRGRSPHNKGERYPADPPTVEEIVEVMRAVGDRTDGQRLRVLIVLLWRAGLRISEALALQESDLDATAARSSSGEAYAEFGIAPLMPGRALCRVAARGERVAVDRRLRSAVIGSA
jgi:integrase